MKKNRINDEELENVSGGVGVILEQSSESSMEFENQQSVNSSSSRASTMRLNQNMRQGLDQGVEWGINNTSIQEFAATFRQSNQAGLSVCDLKNDNNSGRTK